MHCVCVCVRACVCVCVCAMCAMCVGVGVFVCCSLVWVTWTPRETGDMPGISLR